LTGQSPPAPFRYRHFGSLATIGREAAVVELGPVHISGALAWWFWGAAHVLFLVGGRNRATVILDWLWAYLTYRRSTRLITGEA
jgi:NADH dehydrogenase/putative oxidoreductase